MMSNTTGGQEQKGMVPIVLLVAIIVGVVAVGGVGYYFYSSSKPAAPVREAGQAAGARPTSGATANSLESLQVAAPSFGIPSSSPLPSLRASALNPASAALPSSGIFRNLDAKTDTSYSYKLDIAMPAVQLDVPAAVAPATTGGTTTGGGTTGGTTGGADQTTPTASNCAQFSAMPSAQYCSAAGDPNGIALCQACKAAGF